MKARKLDKNVLKLWYIRALIATVIMLGIFVCAVLLVDEGKVRLTIAIALGIPDAAAIACILILPYLRFKMFEYGYDDKQIYVKRGVIFIEDHA